MTDSSKEEVAINVDHVSKMFKLPHEKKRSLKSAFLSSFRKKTFEKQVALKDIDFKIKKGEFFGVVGRNGSGKSTLLKCMAGVYTPTKGSIKVNGSLVPFIELGVGFQPELTGRDNVYLNGALLGFSREQMNELYDEIVSFAELEKFMDQKINNYSSGMQVRLAFSIAIRTQSEILLLDEVLAVGDENFKKKCLEYFENIKLANKTVVFVTHDMTSVRQFCDRAMLIESGKIVKIGKPELISEKYSKMNLRSSSRSLKKSNRKQKEDDIERFGNGKATILDIWTCDINDNKTDTFSPNEQIIAKVKIKANGDLRNSAFGMTFNAQNGLDVFATNTTVKKIEIIKLKKGQEIIVSVSVKNIFSDGFYKISSSITDKTRMEIYSRVVNMHKIEVGGWELKTGFVNPDNDISIDY